MNENNWNTSSIPYDYNYSAVNWVQSLKQLLEDSSFDGIMVRNAVDTLNQLRWNIPVNSFALLADLNDVVKKAESLLYVFYEDASEPKFNGDSVNWFRFWVSFERKVHAREDFPVGFKFACLKQRLEDLPLDIFLELNSKMTSYFSALNLLQKTYVQEKVLVESHSNALLELKYPIATSVSLMKFSSDVEYHIQALKAYGTNIEEAGFFVVAALIKKLPNKIQDRINKYKIKSYWTLPEFQRALKGVIHFLNTEYNPHSATESRNFTAQPYNTIEYSLQCQLCSGPHEVNNCTIHKTPIKKIERAKQLRLCLKCFGVNHSTGSCLNDNCLFCNGNHNTLLCCLAADSQVDNKTPKVKNKKNKCSLCSKKHDITGCTNYKTPIQKMKRAKELKLCLLCVKKEHTTEQCFKQDGCCKFCKGKHNTLICNLSPENPKTKKTKKKKNKHVCPLCSEFHKALSCTLFKTKTKKIDRIKHLNLCLICINNNHTTEICIRPACKFCGEKHNTELCLKPRPKIKKDK